MIHTQKKTETLSLSSFPHSRHLETSPPNPYRPPSPLQSMPLRSSLSITSSSILSTGGRTEIA